MGWVFVVIALSAWWLGFSEPQWQLILLTVIAFGHTHFLVGFFYQIKSFWRKPKPFHQLTVFLVLALTALGGTILIFEYLGHAIALLFGLLYFLLHGLFNEQTLLKREAELYVPLPYLASLAVFIMSLLAYTVPDPTFIFSRTLDFIPTDSFIFNSTFSTLGLNIEWFFYLFWAGVITSFTILLFAWWKSRFHRLTVCLTCTYIAILVAVILFGSLPYIYMYFLVIGYHFMTWFLFFWREFSKRSKIIFREFLIAHVIVLAPFVVGAFLFFTADTPSWVYLIFDYKYFAIATYIHITTSFMNDGWFQHLQAKVFSHFG
jgi:hypothetical protein